MHDFDEEDPKLIIQFPHGFGYDTFPLLPEDAKKIAMMKPKTFDTTTQTEEPHVIEIPNNRLTAVRNKNEFQYSYKPSDHATGFKTSWSLFDFPKLAKKIFSSLEELNQLDCYSEDRTITLTLSEDDIYNF